MISMPKVWRFRAPLVLAALCGVLLLQSCKRQTGEPGSTPTKAVQANGMQTDNADAGQKYKEAPVARLQALQQGASVVITAEGLLSDDCNALAPADDQEHKSPAAYELQGNMIAIHVWQFFSEDERCVASSPQWQKNIDIPGMKPGEYTIRAKGTKGPVEVIYRHR